MTIKEKILSLIKKNPYFSLSYLIKETKEKPKVIKNYLLSFKEEGIIFDAGWGIYTTKKQEFKLSTLSRIETLSRLIKKEFPFSKFLIWDTRQLSSLYQHTPRYGITFVETQKELTCSFYEYISKKYQKTYLEQKNKIYFENFSLYLSPVVIRRLIKRAPYKKTQPTLEKILVDIFCDVNTYKYISWQDYWQIWQELAINYRIKIGDLISYSRRRKCFQDLFLQLIDNNIFNNMTFGALFKEVAEVIKNN